MSHVSYSSAVCTLIHAIVYTMPDLYYVVSVIHYFVYNPGKASWDVVN